MLVPNRHGSSSAYRYGFQGQEKDDELKGEGNSLNYTFRMHDPRVGRFFAVDPLEAKYPWYTPYQFSGNRVIDMVELEGLEPSRNKPVGECKNCQIESLKDGDYFSDVQDQKYITVFNNIDQKTFDEFKFQMKQHPGQITNNELANYRLVDIDQSFGVTIGDQFDISIFPDNGYVVISGIEDKVNSLSVTVKTLRGHPDAGENTFSVSYNPTTKSLTWMTHNVSRSNDFILQGGGAGMAGARSIQQKQWKNVIMSVYHSLGSPRVNSAKAIIQEFDYNDFTNTIGEKEEDSSFGEDLMYMFEKPKND